MATFLATMCNRLTTKELTPNLDSVDAKSFAAILTALRLKAGVTTKAKASRATGFSPQTLTRYEKGDRFPSVPALFDYLRGLGLTLHDLADAVDGVRARPSTTPPPTRAEFSGQAAQPLASLDVVTALLGDLRDALNGLDLPRRGPSLVPPTQRDRDP